MNMGRGESNLYSHVSGNRVMVHLNIMWKIIKSVKGFEEKLKKLP